MEASLTPQQIERVRDALESYRVHSSGAFGRKLSWTAIIGKIELYTDYVIDPLNEASQLKNDAEALRQFSKGKPPSTGGKSRAIAERLLASLIDLLKHPEIGLLADDALADAEVDMVLAIRLRNYFLYPHQISKVASDAESLPMAIAGVGRAHLPRLRTH